MSGRIEIGQLQIDSELYALVRDEIAPGSGLEADAVWRGLDRIVADLAGKNRALLARRDELQEQIDAWHTGRKGANIRR